MALSRLQPDKPIISVLTSIATEVECVGPYSDGLAKPTHGRGWAFFFVEPKDSI
jgi:hypothetical protein